MKMSCSLPLLPTAVRHLSHPGRRAQSAGLTPTIILPGQRHNPAALLPLSYGSTRRFWLSADAVVLEKGRSGVPTEPTQGRPLSPARAQPRPAGRPPGPYSPAGRPRSHPRAAAARARLPGPERRPAPGPSEWPRRAAGGRPGRGPSPPARPPRTAAGACRAEEGPCRKGPPADGLPDAAALAATAHLPLMVPNRPRRQERPSREATAGNHRPQPAPFKRRRAACWAAPRLAPPPTAPCRAVPEQSALWRPLRSYPQAALWGGAWPQGSGGRCGPSWCPTAVPSGTRQGQLRSSRRFSASRCAAASPEKSRGQRACE